MLATAERSPAGRPSLSMVFCSPSSSLMAYQRATFGVTRVPSTSMTRPSASSTSEVKRRSDAAGVPFFAASMAVFSSSSMPRPLSADVSTTGQPSLADSLATSILSPFFSTRSIMFSATTTGRPRSRICVVR